MSCDWNIRCVDCKETLHFNDANHQEELMWKLIRHADLIAALAPLFADKAYGDVELRCSYGYIDPRWFAKHRGHKLVPISEYGDLATACTEYVECACGSSRRCTLDIGHAGDHSAAKR